jgi:hypothetical protein
MSDTILGAGARKIDLDVLFDMESPEEWLLCVEERLLFFVSSQHSSVLIRRRFH